MTRFGTVFAVGPCRFTSSEGSYFLPLQERISQSRHDLEILEPHSLEKLYSQLQLRVFTTVTVVIAPFQKGRLDAMKNSSEHGPREPNVQ